MEELESTMLSIPLNDWDLNQGAIEFVGLLEHKEDTAKTPTQPTATGRGSATFQTAKQIKWQHDGSI